MRRIVYICVGAWLTVMAGYAVGYPEGITPLSFHSTSAMLYNTSSDNAPDEVRRGMYSTADNRYRNRHQDRYCEDNRIYSTVEPSMDRHSTYAIENGERYNNGFRETRYTPAINESGFAVAPTPSVRRARGFNVIPDPDPDADPSTNPENGAPVGDALLPLLLMVAAWVALRPRHRHTT